VQDDLIKSIKPELIAWLRRELKNSGIELQVKVTESEQEKIIYSDRDKYIEMVKKNPMLDVLKRKFKLDFD
jgi:tRNA A37 threonylcarbamoyladenosine dehydratase